MKEIWDEHHAFESTNDDRASLPKIPVKIGCFAIAIFVFLLIGGLIGLIIKSAMDGDLGQLCIGFILLISFVYGLISESSKKK